MSNNTIYLGNPFSGEIRGRYLDNPFGVEAQGSKVALSYEKSPLPSIFRSFQDIALEKGDVLLKTYPSFTDVIVEDFAGIPYGKGDVSNCNRAQLGQFEVGLDVGGVYVSNPYTLPYIPGQFLILVDCFKLVEEDMASSYYKRRYVETTADTLGTSPNLDFQGLLPSNGYAAGRSYSIPAPLKGNSFVFSLNNGLTEPLIVTGWALLFSP